MAAANTVSLMRHVLRLVGRGTPATPDGQSFAATASEPEGKVLVFDTASGEEVLKLTGFRGRVTALGFAPDGRRLLSALDDTTVLVWDLKKP